MAIKINIDKSFFNEVYTPFLLRDERYQVFFGSAGSGKSRFIAQNLVINLLKEKRKLLVVRAVFNTIKDSVFNELITVLDQMKILNQVKINKSRLGITFPNGSEIIFKGTDDESKLLSISGIDSVWLEEADQISFEVWTQLKLRLRGTGKKKKFYLSFNPTSSLSWLKKEFFDNKKEDCFVLKTTYKDNKFLDSEYIKSIEELKTSNPLKYKVYGLGEWGTLGKLVYENWKKDKINILNLVKENRNLKEVYGLDFGFINDPTTLVCCLIDEEKRKLYIFDEFYEKGLLNNEIAELIKAKGYERKKIIADSAEQKSIEEIKKYGIHNIKPARKGAGSIMSGIQYLQQYEMIVDEKCKFTINELENYSYVKDQKTGIYLNKPIDEFNHILDSLRYSVEEFSMNKSKMTVLDKKLFGF